MCHTQYIHTRAYIQIVFSDLVTSIEKMAMMMMIINSIQTLNYAHFSFAAINLHIDPFVYMQRSIENIMRSF